MFKSVDTDNDNGVTQAEFDKFLDSMAPPPPPPSPKKSSKKKAGAEGVGVQPWHKDALVKFYAKHGMWAVFQSRCLVSLLLLVAASFPS